MPEHRLAKRAGTALATEGSTAQTLGWVQDTNGFVTDRSANAFAVKASTDASTLVHVQDCLWQEKAVSNAAATALFDVAVPSGTTASGTAEYIMNVTDGTDYQSMSGYITYAAVNKAGTLTVTVNYATGNDAKAVSGGSTLTLAWTASTGTNKFTVKLQTTTSLTATTNYVILCILPVRGVVTLD